jgi:ATP-dependent Clp protease ATP-binding subunit ClpA
MRMIQLGLLRTALAMQAMLPELNRQLAPTVGADLALRIGVHTGEVLAAAGAERRGLVTGETMAIAARLQQIAPANSIAVSERTHQLCKARFDFASLGEMQLKGVSQPIKAWLAVAESADEATPFVSPLVGRLDEMELLRLLLRRCSKEKRPHVATLVGPAGIGKSRLAHEFAQQAASGGRAGDIPLTVR